MKKAILAVFVVSMFAMGCEQKSSGGAAPAAPGSPAAASATGATAEAAIPTQEDYEQKAETTITTANADAELAKLEKEIGTK